MQSFAEPFAPLGEAARRRSRDGALAAAPDGMGEFWLFTYGSLMWDAIFPHAAAQPARLLGWRREMCIWTALARGTPARPGLALGLLPGGSCDGIAYLIAAGQRDRALAMVWRREMWTDAYRPTWVTLEIDNMVKPALTFTSNPTSRQFADGLAPAHIADYIAQAVGERGPCRDYLANTAARLTSMGIEDARLSALDRLVKSRP